MSSDRQNKPQLVGRSIRGPGHIEDEIPNQDSWTGKLLSDDQIVIAVGDGVGSADLSEKGSKVATQEACRSLEEYLESTDTIAEESVDEAFKESFERARAAVREKADDLDEPPSELQTTLLAVVAGPSGIGGAAVGDGGIVCERGDSYELLVEREMGIVDLPASNITHPLVQDEWPSYRSGFFESCSGVVVFTDGVEEFVWDGLESVRSGFFDGVFEIARKIQNPKGASEKLEELLTSEEFNRFSDDKTVAVGDLPSNIRLEGVKADSGEEVSLGAQIKRETNSSTYRIGDSDSDAAKLFESADVDRSALRAKVEEMIQHPPEVPADSGENLSFAWPTDVLERDESGEFLGYQMSLPTLEDVTDVLDFAKERTSQATGSSPGLLHTLLHSIGIAGNSTSQDHRYTVALALAEGVDALHRAGYAIGNFHHSKIFVDGTNVVFVDCDEFHIGTETEPEKINNRAPVYAPSTNEATREVVQQGDRFALAVHIFQLLMDGYHPFQAIGSGALESRSEAMIRENPFPYRAPDAEYLSPPEETPSYAELPPELRDLFEVCFIEGRRVPEMRPSASIWIDALEVSS
jgi:hypothetical protein